MVWVEGSEKGGNLENVALRGTLVQLPAGKACSAFTLSKLTDPVRVNRPNPSKVKTHNSETSIIPYSVIVIVIRTCHHHPPHSLISYLSQSWRDWPAPLCSVQSPYHSVRCGCEPSFPPIPKRNPFRARPDDDPLDHRPSTLS
jgi:hypothetical protein